MKTADVALSDRYDARFPPMSLQANAKTMLVHGERIITVTLYTIVCVTHHLSNCLIRSQ